MRERVWRARAGAASQALREACGHGPICRSLWAVGCVVRAGSQAPRCGGCARAAGGGAGLGKLIEIARSAIPRAFVSEDRKYEARIRGAGMRAPHAWWRRHLSDDYRSYFSLICWTGSMTYCLTTIADVARRRVSDGALRDGLGCISQHLAMYWNPLSGFD